MKVPIIVSLLVPVALFVVVAVPAEADGVLLRVEDLDNEAARKADPAPFEWLARLREQLPDIADRTHDRYPPLTGALRAMGPDGLLPMLEQIAVAAPVRGELPDRLWLAWQVAMLEAVGAQRDPCAAPVLWAVLVMGEAEPMVLEAAASAVAKLGTDEVAARLIALSEGPDTDLRRAVLAGMGHCRRAEVARRLADELASKPRTQVALAVTRSLGDVGSAWAWRTPAVAAHVQEELTARSIAARALLDAYLAYDDEVRDLAAKAILVVAHPHTAELISTASEGASPGDLELLTSLSERYTRSPIR
jgi:hypothetical protein